MEQLGLILLFHRVISGIVILVHGAVVGGVDRVGEYVGAIVAAQPEGGGRGAAGSEGQELARALDRGQGRIGVGHVITDPVGQTAQDTGRVAVAQLLLDARAVVLLVEVIADQVEPGVGIGLPRQGAADRIQVAPVDPGIVVGVVGIAVAVEIGAGDADPQRVGQGQVEHPLHLLGIVIAVFELAGGVDRRQVGLGGDEVDHARGRVAAEQRALRPAQDFDPLKVEEFALKQAGDDQRHVVDVDRGRRVAGGADAQIADAADGEARRREIGLGEGDVGQRLLQRQRVDDLLLFQIGGGKGADRDRHVLQPLRLALGGDDDVAGIARIGDRIGLAAHRFLAGAAGRGGVLRRAGGGSLRQRRGCRQQGDRRCGEQLELVHGGHPLLKRVGLMPMSHSSLFRYGA